MEVLSTQRVVQAPAKSHVAVEQKAAPQQPEIESRAASLKPEDIDMEAAVEQMQAFAVEHDISLDFSVHKGTGRTVIRIIDAETNKVVRELPPEEILNMVVSLEKLAGHLLNAQA